MGLCGSKNRVEHGTYQRFQKIADRFETIEEVQRALRQSGLEACQLIVGIDFTKSNRWTGEVSFGGRCLHSIDGPLNPYLTALSLIARTLEDFDDDHLIPCYGFGDVTTKEISVFSLFPENQPARGLQELVRRYRELVPHIQLSGPTSFAALIRQTMRHVYHMGMEFHVLLIVADGQISPPCVQETMNAIVEASMFPISIVLVGVGDGPWSAMRYFDDSLPRRKWDNFQFVEFNKIMRSGVSISDKRREASFALNGLMELPDQYKIAQYLIGQAAKEKVQNIVSSVPLTILRDPPVPLTHEHGQSATPVASQ